MKQTSPEQIEAAASAVANTRAGRRGVPHISNVLQVLPANLKKEVLEDAEAALGAVGDVYDPGQLTRKDDTVTLELSPPDVKYLEIDLEHVRASDGIRVSYDFERDGWVIEQASIFEWAADDTDCDPDWQEVAFIRSWARYKDK